jgi:serine/threonine-protein kinase
MDENDTKPPTDQPPKSADGDFSLADLNAPAAPANGKDDLNVTPYELSNVLESDATDEASAENTDTEPTEGNNAIAKATTKLGDFLLVKKIGEGGMGVVYEAHQIGLDRVVALKVPAKHLCKDRKFVKRFQREARVMAQLDHPNILRCFTNGESHGFLYLAMELAAAGSLENWIERLGQLSVGDSLRVIIDATAGLQHAHEQNLVHRDVKPGNVLITGKGMVKVSDLGLAKAMSEEDVSLTRSGTGVGTPLYMPPEQMKEAKNVDARSDIYALGGMLYRCLTGRPPFKGENYLELFQAKEKGHYPRPRSFNKDVPPKLELIIGRMLEKDPKYRYQSCAELIQELEGLGMANPVLSFIGADMTPRDLALPVAKPTAAVKPPSSVSTTPSLSKTTAEPEWWYIRALNFDGVRRLSRNQIIDLIQKPNFDLKAQASRSRDKGFQPLASFGEFEPVIRSLFKKQHLDMKGTRYKNQMAALIKEEADFQEEQENTRQYRRFVVWVAPLLALALLSGVGYAIYLIVKTIGAK